MLPVAVAVAVLLVVVAVLLATGGDDADQAQSPGAGAGASPDPGGSPPPGDSPPPSDAPADAEDGTLPIDAYAEVGERGLALVYTNGVAECYGTVGRPRVTETADAVTVTLPRTPPTGGPDTACVEIALIDSVQVALAAPLGDRAVLDGSRNDAKVAPGPLPDEQTIIP
jgi:hypothetical protein